MRPDQCAHPVGGAGLDRGFVFARETVARAERAVGRSASTATRAGTGPDAAASASGSALTLGRCCIAIAVNATARRTRMWAAAVRCTRGDAENHAPAARAWTNLADPAAIWPRILS